MNYLNQYMFFVDRSPGNKFQWTLNQNTTIFIQENNFENVGCKTVAILSRPQSRKMLVRSCILMGHVTQWQRHYYVKTTSRRLFDIIKTLLLCNLSVGMSPTILRGARQYMHYKDVIMGTIASQITSLTIVYSTVYSDADQRKHQSSESLTFVRGIHRSPVNSPHKWPVTRKMFSFDDVIMDPCSLCKVTRWFND